MGLKFDPCALNGSTSSVKILSVKTGAIKELQYHTFWQNYMYQIKFNLQDEEIP